MVVLVTGGSGFIGSHIVDALLEHGTSVRVLDKLRPARPETDWVSGDLLSMDDVNRAVYDVEAVYHLAATADVNIAKTDPERCLTVNELGTLNLLRACEGHEVDRFILASTVWVYGKANGTVTEDTVIQPPGDLYTKTKIGQEHLVYSWSQSHSLPYTILRYDIPYGPRMRSNMAIASFVRRAMRKEPVTVYGDGKQGRCWVYVSDLAEANRLAMKHQASNQIINIAGKEFVTISQIVEMLKDSFGDFPVNHEPAREGDFSGVKTSIEKARHILGWSPDTAFRDGLKRYIESVHS